MSKASEWAINRPPGCAYHGETIAQVSVAGSVVLIGWTRDNLKTSVEVPPDMALAMARWILDTFGDDAA